MIVSLDSAVVVPTLQELVIDPSFIIVSLYSAVVVPTLQELVIEQFLYIVSWNVEECSEKFQTLICIEIVGFSLERALPYLKIGHKGRKSSKHHSLQIDFAINRPVTRSQFRDRNRLVQIEMTL